MISEFQELADKIDQLAAMTHTLRHENAYLRQANAALVLDNHAFSERISEAQQRLQALLEKIPELVQAGLAEAADEVKEGAQ